MAAMHGMPMYICPEAAFSGEIAIGSMLAQALELHGRSARNALTTDTESLSYRELAERVAATAHALAGAGIADGEVVALRGDRTAETVILFLAALRIGAPALIFDPGTPEELLAQQFDMCGVKRPPLAPSQLPVPSASARITEPEPDKLAMIQLTSGSTGKPKGALLSQGNLACNAAGILDRTGLSPDDRLLHIMPLHHTNGINNQIIAPILAGASILLQSRFKAERAVDALSQNDITIMTGVPTIFARMLPLVQGKRFPSLRFLRCGSAPLTEQLHREIEAGFKTPLIVSYGLSEATCTSVMNVPDDRCIGSVGRALRGQKLAIFRPGSDEQLESGEGEIRIGGPALMQGYVGSADQPIVSGWLRTGDLGTIDGAGNLRITGRLKDIIIRGGENLSPAEIEAAALELADVDACCVVGAPHKDLGEVPVLFVTTSADAIDIAQISAHVRARLSRIHEPARVIVLAALPENSVGKIDRKALIAML
ncbi:class I adenylate-forming enzyme family protein [Sphingobium sp. B11D3D]|uniref:class I adenylate-forming enzyme family protein n=1 Tax=Sphingobium sp. B11D3D TaxID=2940576 RepID=UPI0022240044|nr:class I adenylate-forming enzyme family protein [Sphingobium sp. B11D3D]MCW2370074.1 acyl-CoA synthetase (AMP-forming)/AMP-acid ligase II [Sphingobium sp. B11D3D]